VSPRFAAVLAAALLAGALPAEATYIDTLYPLQQFIEESEVIAEGVVEKTDLKKGIATVRVTRSIKGRCHYEVVRMNMGVGQEWHPNVVFPHLVTGAPAVIFYNAERRAEIYVNRFFLQFSGDSGAPADKAWWSFTHIEVHCNRTFNGTTEELARLLLDVQAGKVKAPPADAKAPVITKESMLSLPVWGKPVDADKLPAPFVRRDPTKARKARDAEIPQGLAKGLGVQYYEGTWDALPDFTALKPSATGIADQVDLSKRRRDEQYALRFTGYLDIPRDGIYHFHVTSDDGAKIYIGPDEVVTNDGCHGPQEASGEAALKAGKHPFTLVYFQNGGGATLELQWEGPDLPKQKVPAAALSHLPAP
jgi:hypothetical protein